jgi:hypothetical protein
MPRVLRRNFVVRHGIHSTRENKIESLLYDLYGDSLAVFQMTLNEITFASPNVTTLTITDHFYLVIS